MPSETAKTVYAALAANAIIAVAKGVGGVISGSAAMLAEAAHSVADTANQVVLRLSVSLGQRAPDQKHQFGYGKERFFWAFLAVVGILVAGAVFAIGEGLRRLLSGEGEQGGYVISYAILGLAFVAESLALLRAVRQTRADARRVGLPLRRFLPESRNPTVKIALLEDTAALVGILIALAGVGLHHLTGSVAWDAGASILIGLLLVGIAIGLGHDIKGLLVGEAARAEEEEALRAAICRRDEVEELLELRTMALGPEELLVAVRLALRGGLESSAIERFSSELDSELCEVVPNASEVFIDATPRHEVRGEPAEAGSREA